MFLKTQGVDFKNLGIIPEDLPDTSAKTKASSLDMSGSTKTEKVDNVKAKAKAKTSKPPNGAKIASAATAASAASAASTASSASSASATAAIAGKPAVGVKAAEASIAGKPIVGVQATTKISESLGWKVYDDEPKPWSAEEKKKYFADMETHPLFMDDKDVTVAEKEVY